MHVITLNTALRPLHYLAAAQKPYSHPTLNGQLLALTHQQTQTLSYAIRLLCRVDGTRAWTDSEVYRLIDLIDCANQAGVQAHVVLTTKINTETRAGIADASTVKEHAVRFVLDRLRQKAFTTGILDPDRSEEAATEAAWWEREAHTL